MKIRAIQMLTLVVFLASLAIYFSGPGSAEVSTGTTLTVYKTTAAVTLDGDASEAAWTNADSITITNIENSGQDVVIKAIHDGTYIYVHGYWDDVNKSNERRHWIYNGTHWNNTGLDEDRLNFGWAIGSNTIACVHGAKGTGDGDAAMDMDVWHWKASRTEPAGYADDKYWSGTGRHGDDKTGGSYKDNSVVKQAGSAQNITDALGNTTSVSAFSDADRPYWMNNGTIIDWGGNGANATALDSSNIVGYTTSLAIGSRGDILTKATYASAHWSVEMKRKLDTGHTDDDIIFAEGGSYKFFVSIHNQATEGDHLIAGGRSTPTEYTLVVSAATGPETSEPTSAAPTSEESSADEDSPGFGIVAVGLGLVFMALILAPRVRRQK
ncbi:MAG: ethylbenzene dehydrogenase-related protein [Candidatus Heimdallarchaeota archaeon]